jgi:hypothetical protein
VPTREVGRKDGFSGASLMNRRFKYGGMDISAAKRLR